MRLRYRAVAGVLSCLTLALVGGGRADPGEGMAFIRTGDGWFYIDRTEVTVAQFQAFDFSGHACGAGRRNAFHGRPV